MRKLKLLLWILTGSCALWGFLSLLAPDFVTLLSRAPVNIVNAVIVAVASDLGGEPLFVLSGDAADHAFPLLAVGTFFAFILCILQSMSAYAHLQESQQMAWRFAEENQCKLHEFEWQFHSALANVPGDSAFDRLTYVVDCFEDYETACERLGVKNGEELLPALEKLLAQQLTPPLDHQQDAPRDLADAGQS